MNAMKRPIPAGIAFLTAVGIASNMIFLRPVTVRRINTRPSMSMRRSAFANESPKPRTTVYTKNALSPIPGA